MDVGSGSGHKVQALQDAFGSECTGRLIVQDRSEILEITIVSSDIEKKKESYDHLDDSAETVCSGAWC